MNCVRVARDTHKKTMASENRALYLRRSFRRPVVNKIVCVSSGAHTHTKKTVPNDDGSNYDGRTL